MHLIHQLWRNPAQRHPQLVGGHEVVFLQGQDGSELRSAATPAHRLCLPLLTLYLQWARP